MFCPSCGHENADIAEFCGNCGAALKKLGGGGAAERVNTAKASTEVVSAGMKWGITALSVLIPLVGIVMGIIYLRDDNPEKKSVGKLWLGVGIGMVVLLFLYEFGG
jgi:uncharacterized membrane protein YvbJ